MTRSGTTIDYVSPLPPVRSGIADYSVDLLPHLLAEGADVRVLGLSGQPVAPEVAQRFGVVPADVARPAAGWAGASRLALYQMGNNLHHRPVEAMALERPGVLTLHDLVLHHLVSEETLGERDFEAYRRRVEADHGWIGRDAARPRLWGAAVEALLFALPAHRTLLRRQRGVLVHNRYAAERIAEDDPEVRVAVVPMAVPLPEPPDPAAGLAFRRRHGVPDGVPLLGSFGFQTPIKRTERVVEALAAPLLAGVHLLVVGESLRKQGRSLEELARELGVADRVHVTGFVPYADFEAAIAATDLALNLRYPTAGETSASLLRVLALGRPAVVSEHAQFAELSDAVAVKVPLAGAFDDGGEAHEVAALVARLGELLAAPERLAAMGRAAREHVRTRHDPADAARAILDACREWCSAPPPGDRPATPPPPTSRVREELAGRIELAEPAALEGASWPVGARRRIAFRLTNEGPARWLAAHRGAGGMALEVSLSTAGGPLREYRPWLALPRDLEPGESLVLATDVRRPPEPATLHAATRVAGVEPPGTFAAGASGAAGPWGGPTAAWELPWP